MHEKPLRNGFGGTMPPIMQHDTKNRIVSKLAGAMRREVELLYPRYVLAHAMSAALPQLTFNRTRTEILRAGGLRIGRRSLVMGPIRITGGGDRGELFSIGTDSVITGRLHVDLGASVHIGDRVYIGYDVTLLTVDHEIGSTRQRCGGHDKLPIIIRNGVWIGSRVTILPGVTVGEGAVIATGAVVARDVPPDTLVAGVPADVMRELDEGAPSSIRKRGRAASEGGGAPTEAVSHTRSAVHWLSAVRRKANRA
jgi:acetyltransferase-like isoleucine patch superfamily enzyme